MKTNPPPKTGVQLRSPTGGRTFVRLEPDDIGPELTLTVRHPRVARLKARGWEIDSVSVGTTTRTSRRGRPAPKEDTHEVHKATSKSTSQSHGGDEATGDIADSPNAAPDGIQRAGAADAQVEPGERDADPAESDNRRIAAPERPRGRRSSARSTRQANPAAPRPPAGSAQGGWVRATACLDPDGQAAAKQAAALLAELAGAGARPIIHGAEVDALELLLALELGDNPLPALEAPRQRPQATVLITNDESGSTQAWSGAAKAWAERLTAHPDVTVEYAVNFNGHLLGEDARDLDAGEVERLIRRCNLVVYLGDSDGLDSCRAWANAGATVLCLDTYRARSESPMLAEKAPTRRGGQLIHITEVSAKAPHTWVDALRLALNAANVT